MRYIIDFLNTTSQNELDLYLSSNNITIIKAYSLYEKVYLVESNVTPPMDPIVSSVINDENSQIELLNYNSVIFSDNENHWWKYTCIMRPDINSTEQVYNRKGNDAIVYLLDSGIKADHQEFINADIETLYSFNNDTNDYNGHGTALASLIVGETCGITSASLKSIKIFQSGVSTNLSHLINALDTVYVYSQSNPKKLHIVNISWIIAKNSYLEEKIKILIDNGVIVVAAAGNNGVPIQDVTPAGMQEVITVGSFNQDLVPCDFSNYTGEISTSNNYVNYGELDVWAPGEKIRCASIGPLLYAFNAGTSISAAIHSAAVAFNSNAYLTKDNPFLTAEQRWKFAYGDSIGREGLLQLSEKYYGSVNKITTIRTIEDSIRGANYGKIQTVNIKGLGSSFHQKLLCKPFAYKSVSLKDPLPSEFTINNFWITGKKEVNEIFEYSTLLTYTKHDDTSYNVPLKIKLYPDSMINDEEVSILLQSGSCPPKFPGGGCEDMCGVSGPCFDCEPKVGPLCICSQTNECP